MTVTKATTIGSHVLGRPFGLGCQSSSGREIPRESLCSAGHYTNVQLEVSSPDLFLPLSAFWKISVSAEDLRDTLRGQVVLLRLCLHSNGWIKGKGPELLRYNRLPSPVH